MADSLEEILPGSENSKKAGSSAIKSQNGESDI